MIVTDVTITMGVTGEMIEMIAGTAGTIVMIVEEEIVGGIETINTTDETDAKHSVVASTPSSVAYKCLPRNHQTFFGSPTALPALPSSLLFCSSLHAE